MNKKRVAVLVSGGGTNLQALIDAPMPHVDLSLVVSSRAGAFALERARKAEIPAFVLPGKDYAVLLAKLREYAIEYIVLAGFLWILDDTILSAYPERVINVHPSLIPAFCGDGFYGLRVHEAALARGVKTTGATVHIVNDVVDGGRILAQKAVDVLPGDDAETLQKRVMERAEWAILPDTLEKLCGGEIT